MCEDRASGCVKTERDAVKKERDAVETERVGVWGQRDAVMIEREGVWRQSEWACGDRARWCEDRASECVKTERVGL